MQQMLYTFSEILLTKVFMTSCLNLFVLWEHTYTFYTQLNEYKQS